LLYRN